MDKNVPVMCSNESVRPTSTHAYIEKKVYSYYADREIIPPDWLDNYAVSAITARAVGEP